MLLQLLGRLHILILHLPIGILLLVCLLEWIDRWKLQSVPRHIITLQYGIGTISAILACITGYLLSVNGDYNDNIIDNHMYAGIATALLSCLTFWVSYKEKIHNLRWWSLALVMIIIITGHLGGNLTHGEGFLTNLSSNNETHTDGPVFTISKIEDAQLFHDLIKPILHARCVNCHGPSKNKGKLRLDAKEFISDGGKSGNPLIDVDAAESELLYRMQLPLSDKKHMPPKNKSQITADELLLIERWIEMGNPFDKTVGTLIATDTSIYQLIERIINDNKSGNFRDQSSIVPAVLPVAYDLELPSEQLLNNLMELDIVALRAGVESPFLELNFINVSELKEIHWKAIGNLAPNIVRLKLSGQNITDKDLIKISEMNNLMKLFIDQTLITDNGLSHLINLSHLNYLNINNTVVTDEGIQSLGSMSSLETIYAFNTDVNVSELPGGAKIVNGGFQLQLLESDTIRIPQN